MILQRLNKLNNHGPLRSIIIVSRVAYSGHRKRACSASKAKKDPCARVCGSGGGGGEFPPLVRAQRSGPVRLGFLPDEWFTFFYKKTGVSGPYFLLLGIVNYACSKEILVMEHEYYSGLSIALMLYLITTRLGSTIGGALDKEVDAVFESFQKGRDHEVAYHKTVIKESEMAIKRAEGQKELIAAKKENILLQLEAAYRERAMIVYNSVTGRMLYHIRKDGIINRIHQRWMIEWILRNVRQSITPEFQKAALKSAISDLTNLANKAT